MNDSQQIDKESHERGEESQPTNRYIIINNIWNINLIALIPDNSIPLTKVWVWNRALIPNCSFEWWLCSYDRNYEALEQWRHI